jgi:hypothetical protein
MTIKRRWRRLLIRWVSILGQHDALHALAVLSHEADD